MNCIKIKEIHSDRYVEKVHLTVNKKEEIIRKVSKDDPTARGFRKYKNVLRRGLGAEL